MGSAFEGRRWLVTAGPTYEPIDPVRFLGNFSSGKMGYAIAEALRDRGAEVVLVSGPTCLPPPRGVAVVHVVTAREMLAACRTHFREADGLVMAAAVADFRPRRRKPHKIKKQPGKAQLALELVENPDIVATLTRRKKPHQYVMGFSLETHRGPAHAIEKMRRKRLDAIVLNHPWREGGIGADDNAVVVFGADGSRRRFSRRPKSELAQALVAWIAEQLSSR